jgi:hypothetical protein
MLFDVVDVDTLTRTTRPQQQSSDDHVDFHGDDDNYTKTNLVDDDHVDFDGDTDNRTKVSRPTTTSTSTATTTTK